MLSKLFGRTTRWAVCMVAVVATVLVGVAVPANAAVTATVKTSGGALSVRRAPSLAATVIDSVANGTVISIDCQQTGSAVEIPNTSPVKTTTTWDYVPALGGYLTDAYVNTGTYDRVAPDCGTGTGSAQCNPGTCYAEAQFRPDDGTVVIYDKGDSATATAVQYWTSDGAGPLLLWNTKGNGNSDVKQTGVAVGDWFFYKVCTGDYSTKKVASCSAGISDYR